MALRRLWWRGWLREEAVFFRTEDRRYVVVQRGPHARQEAQMLLADYDTQEAAAPRWLHTGRDLIQLGSPYAGSHVEAIDEDRGVVVLADGRRFHAAGDVLIGETP